MTPTPELITDAKDIIAYNNSLRERAKHLGVICAFKKNEAQAERLAKFVLEQAEEDLVGNLAMLVCRMIHSGKLPPQLQAQAADYLERKGLGGSILREQQADTKPDDDESLTQPDYEEKFHRVMDALRRSRMEHGDCNSGKRYGGIPKACTACMANRKLDQMIDEYQGRTIRLA